jgi:protein-disulfide isomerase
MAKRQMPRIVWLAGVIFFSTLLLAAAETADVLAVVDGQEITAADIEHRIKGQLLKINNELYSVKKQAVEALIAERLLNQEATKRGITPQQLVQQEVTAKMKAVGDEEIEQFYNTHKARMGNQTLDELKDRIAQHLQDVQRRQRHQTLIGELRQAASIRMLLQPPIAEVAIDGAPTRGPENAPVTLVEFSDFQCPYCVRVQPVLQKIRETYKDQVKLVYKDFPLPQIHPQAPKAAEAARCAREQDKYWDYHDRLFQDAKDLTPDKLKRYAADLQLDTAAFDACLDSGKYAAAVRQDMAQGAQLGVNSTPSFFVNGRFLSGAQPFSAFQALIDEVLASK